MKSRKTKIETVIGALISTIAAKGLLIFNGFIIDDVQFVNETLAVCIMGFALLYNIIFNEENNFIIHSDRYTGRDGDRLRFFR